MTRQMRALLRLGMPSGVLYVAAVLWAQANWPGYSGVSDFVSYLSAYGSPNGEIVWALDAAHNLLLLAFVAGLFYLRRGSGNRWIRRGHLLLLCMSVAAFVGYTLIPLNAHEAFFSPRNLTHFVLTILVVVGMLFALWMAGAGHLQQGDRPLGWGCTLLASLVALLGLLTIASMIFWERILGVFQRGMIFSIQAVIFYLSLVYTVRCNRAPAVV